MLNKIKTGVKVLLLILGMSLFPQSALRCANQDVEQIIVGEARIFSTQSPTRVVIGNPKIADIGEVTNKEISVVAKAPGVTNLVYWDVFGEQSVNIRVISEDMNEIKTRVDNLISKLDFPEVHTEAINEEGKVLLTGRVKTAQDKNTIIAALGPLKANITDLLTVREEETAIEIDVQILELNKDASKTLGFTWPGTMTITEVGSAGLAAAPWGSLFRVLTEKRNAPFTLKLDALIQEGKAKVLSRPRISCQSGKEAELMVGGEKPTFTTSNNATAGNTTSTIEYKEFGIKLKVQPTVTEAGRIKVGVNVSVSEIGDAVTIGPVDAVTGLAYPLTKRTASTEVYVDDGQTFAIGGLIKQKTEEDVTRTPFLSEIPVLGALWRSRATKVGSGQGARGNVELFIILTPRIVNSERWGQAQKTNNVKPVVPELKTELNLQDPLVRYSEVVKNKLLSNLSYPPEAKEAGFNGVVKLKLHLSFQGELLEAVVQNGSGFKILDESALNAAKGIALYPPFPPAIASKDIWVEIPIVFRLD